MSPKEGGAECIPTTVLVHSQEQDILYESLSSSDSITKTVLNRSVPVPPTHPASSRVMLVRKNDKLQQVNLLTLNRLVPSREMVNICGILVKRTGIQHCPSGDFRCNILLIDETTSVPFHVSVFFREASSYSIFRVLLLALFERSAWALLFSFRLSMFRSIKTELMALRHQNIRVLHCLILCKISLKQSMT